LDVVGGRLTRELACVAVEVDGTRVPVFYVQGDQINAIGPWTDNTGAMDVRVILNPGRSNEIRSAAASATVAEFSPAFFTFNTKSIAAINSTRGGIVADPAVIAGGTPAKPGDVVTLYGTGFGWTTPVFGSGEFSTGAAPVREAATVTIGGTTLAAADVLYVGLSPDAPGFYQINVRIPAAAADGDLPVSIRIGGVATQAGATIPVKR
jgi:uncharacterized protein (TIGR03437 family)